MLPWALLLVDSGWIVAFRPVLSLFRLSDFEWGASGCSHSENKTQIFNNPICMLYYWRNFVLFLFFIHLYKHWLRAMFRVISQNMFWAWQGSVFFFLDYDPLLEAHFSLLLCFLQNYVDCSGAFSVPDIYFTLNYYYLLKSSLSLYSYLIITVILYYSSV